MTGTRCRLRTTRRRRALLSRVVAVVLLLWTAADLSNMNLCALDHEGAAWADGPHETAMTAGDPAPFAPLPTTHVDDCFCCSHCVDIQQIPAEYRCTPVSWIPPSQPVPPPRIFAAAVYRPPLPSRA